ncbi:MBL fold metallo-hydrolase [Luteipulveratus sp. YIM 133132]|uniref:MBL fold metallo-hydrolase n=1 Tax=Luteipulveratus flavus TaxID=3031728 RepID=UPI0023B09FE0|nr:MBL fold metallo-hydrolase [Luteipulveratus sp. YIM 133132]MDE9365947.1 MBL fold metallo-hydrolase [Luteipulveratus sp. YIM 133132]
MSALREVAPDVLVATHAYCTTTTTVLLGPGSECLVVDPAVLPGEIDAVAAELDEHGVRVGLGFSTHPHWDHLLWRSSLGHARRLATRAATDAVRAHLPSIRAEARTSVPEVDTTALGDVEALPRGARTLPAPWRHVQVLEHRAHAPGHAALLVPDRRTLMAGDMLSDVEVPLLDLTADDPVGDYHAALDLLAAAAADVDVVVPGHGGVGDGRALRRRIDHDRRYLQELLGSQPSADPRLERGPDWLRAEHAAAVRWVRDHR